MAIDRLLTDPDYINANTATKEAIFEKFASNDHRYLDANSATKAAIKEKYGIGQGAYVEELQSGQNQSLLNTKANERNIPAVLAQSVGKGFANMGDIVAGAPENIKNIGQYAIGKLQGQNVEVPRGATPVTNALVKSGVFSPEREPNTGALRIADTATQIATPGTAFGKIGSIPSFARKTAENIGQGIIGGAALEGAKQEGFTNPIAQELITAGAMYAPGKVYSMRNTPSTVVNQALHGITPEQYAAAQNLVDRSYKLGSPITGAEALSEITHGNKIASIQRYTENQPRGTGEAIMSSFMEKRPKSNETMMANALREINANETNSMTIPPRMAGAAENSIKNAQNLGNVQAKPYYDASKNVPVDNSTVVSLLLNNPKIEQAIRHVNKDPDYGVVNKPIGTVEVFDAGKKYLNDQYESLSREGKNNAARLTSDAAKQITSSMDIISPEYSQARKIVANNIANNVEPMKATPIGPLAETKGYAESAAGAQRNILMPNAPKALNPEEIHKTVKILREQDPTIVADWTKQNLDSIFKESAQNIQSGPNQFGGAKFVKDITGNAAQKDNLKALVEASSGKGTWQGFNNMLEVLQAQGNRMPANSATSFNNILTQEMESGGKGAFLKFPLSIPSSIRNGIQAWELTKNTEMLAKMLTDPQSVNQLKELAKSKPNSTKARNIVNTVVGGYVGQKPELAPEENK
jgi:hypothetical protein